MKLSQDTIAIFERARAGRAIIGQRGLASSESHSLFYTRDIFLNMRFASNKSNEGDRLSKLNFVSFITLQISSKSTCFLRQDSVVRLELWQDRHLNLPSMSRFVDSQSESELGAALPSVHVARERERAIKTLSHGTGAWEARVFVC